jgi:hypothetical protein
LVRDNDGQIYVLGQSALSVRRSCARKSRGHERWCRAVRRVIDPAGRGLPEQLLKMLPSFILRLRVTRPSWCSLLITIRPAQHCFRQMESNWSGSISS